MTFLKVASFSIVAEKHRIEVLENSVTEKKNIFFKYHMNYKYVNYSVY
jgi:hypothetical protein